MFGSLFGRSPTTVDGAAARALVAQGATLLDVRTPEEFASGSIPGAINVPLQVLPARVHELQRDRAYVLFCRSGARSSQALRFLQREGFTQVVDLGGMQRW